VYIWVDQFAEPLIIKTLLAVFTADTVIVPDDAVFVVTTPRCIDFIPLPSIAVKLAITNTF
jgi:hypothetical protein